MKNEGSVKENLMSDAMILADELVSQIRIFNQILETETIPAK